jgi:hypothetical protein
MQDDRTVNDRAIRTDEPLWLAESATPGGLPDDPSLWEGYEQWLGELAAREEQADLLEWARQTLPGPVMPCVCTDKTCLRCRVAAIVDGQP